MPRGVSRIDEARGQGRLWTPRTSIGQQLALWLDAADLSTLTLDTSNRVSSWLDKSGLGNHGSQGTAGNRPIYSPNGGTTAGFPGLPSIFFDKFSSTGILGNISLNGTVCFIYVVCTLNTNADQYGRLVSFGLNGSFDYNNTSYFNMSRDALNNAVRVERAAATQAYGVSLDAPLVLVGCFDGATQYTEGNGKDMAASAQTAALGTANYRIGSHLASTDFWSGYINEVIVDVGPLSINRRQHFVGYLAQKWRFPTALYGTHPYSNDPPLIGV